MPDDGFCSIEIEISRPFEIELEITPAVPTEADVGRAFTIEIEVSRC